MPDQNLPAFITKGRATKVKPRRSAKPSKKTAARHRDIGDVGTPELHKRHRVVAEAREYTANGQVRVKGARVIDQLPIDRYYLRHQLAPKSDTVLAAALYQAARKLHEDFQASGLLQSGRTSFVRAPSGSSAPDKAMTLHVTALTAYNKAVTAISPSLRPILCHVVCYGGTASEWATSNGRNAAGGLALLCAALADLAGYYRFVATKSSKPQTDQRQ